ncbi:MAG: amino acid permease, partial [Anaerolineae bacterium]|nr:amino acid permease [Anaerolineae bacterium]NIN95971.1 amino acid permease [Anaerolineae bacterium]NIQ78933.1 amino acid permease [Anaerolineae bacterium]
MLILTAGEEMRHVEKDAPRALIASLVLGSIFGAFVTAAVLRVLGPSATQSLPLADLAARLGGAIARAWLLAIGMVILAATLNRTLLTLARVAAEMSREGYLPRSWRVTHPQFHTPYLLLTAGGILVALASFYGDPILLTAIAALSFLIVAVLINIPTILSHADRLSRQRPFPLPFSPLVPGLAVAINLFLVTALPVQVLLIGAAWLLVGGLFYILYSRRGVVTARTGV